MPSISSVPFSRIPHQTQLFLDYANLSPKALAFYERPPVFESLESAARRGVRGLAAPRSPVAAILKRQNEAYGCSARTLELIRSFQEPDCVAVVTGQQVGLFTGPLYTIYKALSAVKLAECMSQRGIKAVPVFWMATEDHDFPEVAKAEFINRDCALSSVSAPPELHPEGLPVGRVALDKSLQTTIQNLISALPQTEFSDGLEKLLRDAYQPGRTYGDAFARVMSQLTSQQGLILLDPLDSQLK